MRTALLLDVAAVTVRDRLLERTGTPVVGDRSFGSLEGALARLLGVPVQAIPVNERIRDVLRVDVHEVAPGLQPKVMELGGHVIPHALAILDLIERSVARDPDMLDRPFFQPVPTNEGEWIGRILDATFADLIHACDR